MRAGYHGTVYQFSYDGRPLGRLQPQTIFRNLPSSNLYKSLIVIYINEIN